MLTMNPILGYIPPPMENSLPPRLLCWGPRPASLKPWAEGPMCPPGQPRTQVLFSRGSSQAGGLDHDQALPPSLSSGGVDSARDCEAAHNPTPTKKTALARESPGASLQRGCCPVEAG